MANPIWVTGAAGRVGGVGRTITQLQLQQGKAVRAMVRSEDERSRAMRDLGAEVVAGDLLDLDSMHRVIAGCETMYFGMSASDTYLTATVNVAAVAKFIRSLSIRSFSNTRPRLRARTSRAPRTRRASRRATGIMPVVRRKAATTNQHVIAPARHRATQPMAHNTP